MATDAYTGVAPATLSGPRDPALAQARPASLSTDFRSWKFLAWNGPIFLVAFFVLWGVLGDNIPPHPLPSATPLDVKQFYLDHTTAIEIGMSLCLTLTACYMAWGAAVSQVMHRIEGRDGILSKIELMGATITCAPIMTACALWLTAAHEATTLSPAVLHMMYWAGWLLIDLAYMVTSFQIGAASIVFMRDTREKPLVPAYVCWWGWLTVASFFAVNAIPFVSTGPLAFDGAISFWFAFFTWFFWIPMLSYYVIKAVDRLKAEDAAAAASGSTIATG
jgi:hypothetical protein